jgi:hypothetical protein
MNFTKVFLLVALTSLVHVIVASFPFLGFVILWLGLGVSVDQILIKIGDAEATRRSAAYKHVNFRNTYTSLPPLRILSFALPPIAFLVGITTNLEDVRAAFPQIPKFRNPFYYD